MIVAKAQLKAGMAAHCKPALSHALDAAVRS
ncbi:MAG: hypothetical protein V7646_3890 [Pseudonocardia sp.]